MRLPHLTQLRVDRDILIVGVLSWCRKYAFFKLKLDVIYKDFTALLNLLQIFALRDQGEKLARDFMWVLRFDILPHFHNQVEVFNLGAL